MNTKILILLAGLITIAIMGVVFYFLSKFLKKRAHPASQLLAQAPPRPAQSPIPGGYEILNSIADTIIAVDRNLTIVIFNRAAEMLTGWDSAKAIGMLYTTIFKLKDNNDNDITNQNDPFLQAITTKNRVSTDDFYFLDSKKHKISLSIVAAPTYNEDNQPSGVIGIFHDISEQKALQRERNEFISTASHEMRTPVAAIEGYLSMATNPNLSTIDTRANDYLNKAHDAALHLGSLISDLLSTAKIDERHLLEKIELVNISELITKLADEMRIIAQQKGLSLNSNMGGGAIHSANLVVAPAYMVMADKNRLREVVSNLIDNSIKYTSRGAIDISISANADNVTVNITDSGIGISDEDQKHIFEKFYRANNTMTREVGGTGLGLYIARSLIEHYGGRIWLNSALNRGSTFSFTLPLVK